MTRDKHNSNICLGFTVLHYIDIIFIYVYWWFFCKSSIVYRNLHLYTLSGVLTWCMYSILYHAGDGQRKQNWINMHGDCEMFGVICWLKIIGSHKRWRNVYVKNGLFKGNHKTSISVKQSCNAKDCIGSEKIIINLL